MIKEIFNPKSIAVIGVSTNPVKLGSVIYNNIIVSGYKGNVYPINPKYNEIIGRKCYSSIDEIEGNVDQIIFVIPAVQIPAEFESACKAKNIKSAVIISSGFAETGSDGELLQAKVIEIAEKYNVHVLGPNCLGYINSKINLNASFAATNPADGDITFLSQSGAVCTALLDMSAITNLGFDKFISFGNKSGISELDIIKQCIDDDTVKVIGCYVEDITDRGELVSLVKSSSKPVVLLTTGKSVEAREALMSHTGSLAADYEITRQALVQSGAVWVENIEQLYDSLLGFSWSRPVTGNRVGIITNAGGPAVIATDFAVQQGLEMPALSDTVKALLSDQLNLTVTSNPLDLIGDALADRYSQAIETLAAYEQIDTILIILTPQYVTQIEETARQIINKAQQIDKPVFVAFMGGKYSSMGLQRLYDAKIPAFSFPEDAISVIARLYNFNRKTINHYPNIDLEKETKGMRDSHISTELKNLLRDKSPVVLSEDTVRMLCEKSKIPLPREILTNEIEDIHKFLKLHNKIVIKAQSSDLIHKTEHRAVYLDITTDAEAGYAFYKLQGVINELNNNRSKQLNKLVVQEQLDQYEELFIGIKRDGSKLVYSNRADKGFGHLMFFGKGGIYTEVYKDIAMRLLPLTEAEFGGLIDSTQIAKVIAGARGKTKLAREKLIELFQQIQKLVISYPEISSIDINPCFINTKKVVCADVKIIISN